MSNSASFHDPGATTSELRPGRGASQQGSRSHQGLRGLLVSGRKAMCPSSHSFPGVGSLPHLCLMCAPAYLMQTLLIRSHNFLFFLKCLSDFHRSHPPPWSKRVWMVGGETVQGYCCHPGKGSSGDDDPIFHGRKDGTGVPSLFPRTFGKV